ncbi:MAG: adenine-specific methyltransferase EcoRI family protein [Eubacterium sp.]|nr:adenine-specific methyltransferase EcoRI family protein [Eubacterium sp.]
MAKNALLGKALKDKKDEFYTQLVDIEKELRYYKKHFKDKIVLCNCDDPYESNFFKYFVLNFDKLRLKKLIATCYDGSPIAGRELSISDIDKKSSKGKAYKAIIKTVYDKTGDGAIDMFDIVELFKSGENELTELEGNGDYKSEECIELLKECDIVVTNPPFSLFREYVSKLLEYNKKFIIIGNINAVTYKEFFPLLRDNKVWIGASIHSGDRAFYVPDSYPLDAAGCGIDEKGRKYIRVKGVRWYTNLDIKQRHEELILVKKYNETDYIKYDNYDAINVNKTVEIPYDYDGVMGVPITFMDKYNPEQFDIIGLAAGNIRGLAGIPTSTGKDGPYIDGKLKFGRILIRNKHPEK